MSNTRTIEVPKEYKVYDPAAKAYRTVGVEEAKAFVEAAKEVEAALIADGELE